MKSNKCQMLPNRSIAKFLCLVLSIFAHQYLAQAAQGFMVLAEPIDNRAAATGNFGQSRQDLNLNANANPGSGVYELGLSGGLNLPYYFAQTYFPNTFADLANNYKLLATGAQNGYSGLQSGFNYLTDGSMNHYNKMQQNFNTNYANGEELVRKMYEMLSNPQQMCQQLAAQSQAALKTAGQIPQQVSAQTGSALNQVAQSSDSLLGSVASMKPASTLVNKMFSMGKK